MRRILGVSILALLLAALSASAQRILPDSFAGWSTNRNGSVAPTPRPVLQEYGFDFQDARLYYRGAEAIDVAVYAMKDPSGAYGLYSYLRTPFMSRASLTDHSSESNDRALVLAGNLVLDIRGSHLLSLRSPLKALIAAVAPKAHDGTLPTLWQFLPPDNMLVGTDKYILGPQTLNELFPGGIGASVGFDHGGEAELAHYRLGGRDATLLLVGLPTDQVAAVQLEKLQRDFNVNGTNQSSGVPLFASRSARLLAIVAGASSQAEAKPLLDKIQMETERSWNEPVPKHEPPIELMIEGSIIGSITICLFALVAGFSFGGVRLLVKRWAPGRVFDRNNHLQVLQLGLGSKPINADDFYGYSAPTGPPTVVDKNLPDRVALRIFR